MSLARFSSETVGDRSSRETGGPPGAEGTAILKPLDVSPDDDDGETDAFELALDAALDLFSSERIGASAAPDGLAEALSEFGPAFNSAAPHHEPAPAQPLVTPPPIATRQTVSRPAPAFISTPIEDFEPKKESTPVIAARPAQTPRPTPPTRTAVPATVEPVREQPARASTKGQWVRRASPQALLVAVLLVGGGLEVGWIGIRVARALGTPAGPPAGASVAPPQMPDARPASTVPPQPAREPAPPASTDPKLAPKPLPKPAGPVWVLISTTVPVEIFEAGRRVGTSWGGGLRLSPGTHDLHIVNRALSVEARQSVKIVAGTAMSLVVEVAEGRLRVERPNAPSERSDSPALVNPPGWSFGATI